MRKIREFATENPKILFSEPSNIFSDETRKSAFKFIKHHWTIIKLNIEFCYHSVRLNEKGTKRKIKHIKQQWKSSLRYSEKPPTNSNERSTTEKVVHHPVHEYSRETLKINLERWIKDSIRKVFEDANQYTKSKNEGSKTNDQDLKEADNTFNRLGEIRNGCSFFCF